MLLKNFIRTLPAFGDFSDSETEHLAQAMRVQDYPDEHVFVYQGKQGREVFLLIEGEVRVCRYGDDGLGHDLKVLKSGELFGLLSLSDRGPAAATCVAHGKVKVASLPYTAFDLLLDTAAPIANHFRYAVACQLARDLHDRNQSLRALLHSH